MISLLSQASQQTFETFIFDDEPLEPLEGVFGPLNDFITFEPLFASFCPQNLGI